MLSDWVHINAFLIYSVRTISPAVFCLSTNPRTQGGELSQTLSRNSSSTVMNGHGIFPCNATDADPSTNCTGNPGSRYNLVLTPGKKHLLRIVNTSADMQFRFSIDNHMIDVVAVDFVPIQPYRTDNITVGIGPFCPPPSLHVCVTNELRPTVHRGHHRDPKLHASLPPGPKRQGVLDPHHPIGRLRGPIMGNLADLRGSPVFTQNHDRPGEQTLQQHILHVPFTRVC